MWFRFCQNNDADRDQAQLYLVLTGEQLSKEWRHGLGYIQPRKSRTVLIRFTISCMSWALYYYINLHIIQLMLTQTLHSRAQSILDLIARKPETA